MILETVATLALAVLGFFAAFGPTHPKSTTARTVFFAVPFLLLIANQILWAATGQGFTETATCAIWPTSYSCRPSTGTKTDTMPKLSDVSPSVLNPTTPIVGTAHKTTKPTDAGTMATDQSSQTSPMRTSSISSATPDHLVLRTVSLTIMRDQGVDLVSGEIVDPGPAYGDFALEGWKNDRGGESPTLNFISHGTVLSAVVGQNEPGYADCTDPNVHLTGDDILGITHLPLGTWVCARIPYRLGTGDFGVVVKFRLDQVLAPEAGIVITITVWQ